MPGIPGLSLSDVDNIVYKVLVSGSQRMTQEMHHIIELQLMYAIELHSCVSEVVPRSHAVNKPKYFPRPVLSAILRKRVLKKIVQGSGRVTLG